MKPTHRRKDPADPYEVTAWQYREDAPMPVWVFRKFHNIGGGRGAPLWAIGMDDSTVQLRIGDWAVVLMDSMCIVLTDQEFTDNFEPLTHEVKS